MGKFAPRCSVGGLEPASGMLSSNVAQLERPFGAYAQQGRACFTGLISVTFSFFGQGQGPRRGTGKGQKIAIVNPFQPRPDALEGHGGTFDKTFWELPTAMGRVILRLSVGDARGKGRRWMGVGAGRTSLGVKWAHRSRRRPISCWSRRSRTARRHLFKGGGFRRGKKRG